MVTTVTGKRQITIPVEIASVLNIEAGTQIEWTANKERKTATFTVRPGRKETLARCRQIGREYRDKGESASILLERERSQDEDNRDGELRVAESRVSYRVDGKRRRP